MFGYHQNIINATIRTGVIDVPNVQELYNVSSLDTPQNIIQHEVIVEENRDEEPAVHPENITDEIIDEVGEANEVITGSEDDVACANDSANKKMKSLSRTELIK